MTVEPPEPGPAWRGRCRSLRRKPCARTGRMGAAVKKLAHLLYHRGLAVTALASATTSTNVLPGPGRFRWDIVAGTLTWSRSLFRLHGYKPGEVTPSPALALQHKHPDDFHGCVDALHAGLLTARLIVHEHRVVDRHQQIRPALMIARGTESERGRAAVLWGLLLPTDGDGA